MACRFLCLLGVCVCLLSPFVVFCVLYIHACCFVFGEVCCVVVLCVVCCASVCANVLRVFGLLCLDV